MKRIITHNTVLGLHDQTFKLVKGEEIETFEMDKYGRVRTIIQDREVLVFAITLERISN